MNYVERGTVVSDIDKKAVQKFEKHDKMAKYTPVIHNTLIMNIDKMTADISTQN